MYLQTTETIQPAESLHEITTPEIVNSKFGGVLVEEIPTGGFSIFTAKITILVSGELKEISRVGGTIKIAVEALENVLANEILISEGIH